MNLPTIHTLPNRFRVVAEHVPHVNSVSAGLWLAQGSRHEGALENGMTHFSEHLLFKGTPGRHWQQIAREINQLGGHFNAVTSTDWVKVYGHVISRDLPQTLRLMADMFLDSTFPEVEVKREREVILEEIAQYEDIPEDLCYELFTQALLLPHPVGRPVIGSAELVSSFTRTQLHEYWLSRLAPERMILSLVGNFEEPATLALVEELFGGLNLPAQPLLGMDAAPGKRESIALERDLEQVNFCFGVTGPKRGQDDRFAWSVYDTILGGGMGSRLFDEVRERRGLAYSIGSSINTMHEAGYMMVSGSTRPETADMAVQICREEIRKLADAGPEGHELDTARQQLERSHLLSIESLGLRASINGERALYGLPFLTTDELLRRIASVTKEDVQTIAREVEDFGEPAMCVVGPLKKSKKAKR